MLKQELKLKLNQKLSPQQIQLMKLVQLPTLAFEQRIKQELEENPALEDEMSKDEDEYDSLQDDDFNSDDDYIREDDYEQDEYTKEEVNLEDYMSDDTLQDYKTSSNNYSDDDEDTTVPIAQGMSLHSYLLSQLHTFSMSDEEYLLADFLVGNLDDDGYLRRDIPSIVNDLAFTMGIETDAIHLEYLLKHFVQKLDPVGVGARNLQESLLLQLKSKPQEEHREIAIQLIEEQFDLFVKKHYKKLENKLDINTDQLKLAIDEIERLNPKPGKAYSGDNKMVSQIVPDFSIKIVEGELELTLNGRNAPELRVSREYKNMFEDYQNSKEKSKSQKQAVLFVKQKLDSAKWFIDAIKQRQNTLFATMSAIMEYQKEYFLTGDEQNLKPMILKDIADIIEMDISTVSRVANSKYVNTPYGTLLIKDLFSESMTTDEGEEVSTREIKNIITQIIEAENKKKPLTDEKLTTTLKEKGYPIARRTVAKYREQLNIPVARLRKKL